VISKYIGHRVGHFGQMLLLLLLPNASLAHSVSGCPLPISIVDCVQLRSHRTTEPPVPHPKAPKAVLKSTHNLQSASICRTPVRFMAFWKSVNKCHHTASKCIFSSGQNFLWSLRIFSPFSGLLGDLCGRPMALTLHLTISWLVKKFQMQLQLLLLFRLDKLENVSVAILGTLKNSEHYNTNFN